MTMFIMGVSERNIDGVLRDHVNNIYDVQVCPNNRYAASGGMDIDLRVWDVQNNRLHMKRYEHTDTINSVNFSPDGRYLATGSFDSNAVIYDVENEFNVVGRINGQGWKTIYCIIFSIDSESVIFTADNAIKVYDVETMREKRHFEGHTKYVRCLAMCTRKNLLVSGGHDRTIRIWDFESGMEVGKLEGHDNFVLRVRVTPDDQKILSCSSDNTVRIWNLEEQLLIAVLKGHTTYVKGLAVSPNSKYLASASLDRTIKVWDLETKKQLAQFEHLNMKFDTVDFSKDMKYIYGAGEVEHNIVIYRFLSGE